MVFAGLERGTSGLGVEMIGVVVFCEALLFPDIVENWVTNRSEGVDIGLKNLGQYGVVFDVGFPVNSMKNFFTHFFKLF